MTSLTLIPLLVFLFACLIVAFLIRKHTPGENFEREYFVAGRRLGPIVLVMTTIATFGSITAFVGMPGQAWEYGFGWVYLAGAQVVSLILLFGVVGKKLALIARRIHAVSIIDIINARFRSSILTLILSCALVVFFTALIVAQLVGAAKIFVAVTNYDYSVGLILITATTAIYTVIGGFRGVAITDTICGIVMIISALFLGFGIMNTGGGYENIMQTIAVQKPEMFDIFAGGQIPIGLFVTQWLILGLLVFTMPQVAVRCLSYKSTKSLRHALWIGTLIVGFLLVGLTALGALSAGAFPDLLREHGGNVDDVVPLILTQAFPSWAVDIIILGPIAAAISTVSTLLISSSVNIIQGIYANLALCQRKAPEHNRVRFVSQASSILLSVVALIVALTPPDLIWRMSMYVFGGIEVASCWILVLGLFWHRANKVGAVAGLASGLATYFLLGIFEVNIFSEFDAVIFALIVSLVFMVAGSLFFYVKRDARMLEVFFPERTPSTTAAVYEFESDASSSDKPLTNERVGSSSSKRGK